MENLPKSDSEYWEGEKYISSGKKSTVCEVHSKNNWMNGEYVDNKDGTISCLYCNWGCRLPGRYRIKGNKVIDLRTLKSRKGF